MSNNSAKKDQSSGRFVEYDKSGSVSVRVVDFLRSDSGKEQLKSARELRARTATSRYEKGESARK